MVIENRIKELGIDLPDRSAPKAMYIPVKQVGNLIFVSGQVPTVGMELIHKGKLGDEVSFDEGVECARLCAINILAALRAYLGDLDKVKEIVKIQAFVASTSDFNQQHLVANGASQLLFDVYGEAGRHSRTAVGVNDLPNDAPIEIEAIVEI